MAMKAASRWLQGLAAIEETALTLAGCLLRAGCLMLVFQSKIICGVGYDEMAVYINIKGSQSEAHLLLPPILADVALRVLTLIRSRL